VWDLKSESAEFLQVNGKYVDFPQLQDKERLADYFVAFTVDIMALMNELNFKLQGKGLFYTSDVQPDQNLQGKITPPDTPSRSQQSHPPSDTTSLFPIR
jgi:hypothetical protein